MQILWPGGSPSRALTEYGSSSAAVSFLARADAVSVVRIELEAGGLVGLHEAGVAQLLVVVSGSGWVCGGDGLREPVEAGTVVMWKAGESHESGSDGGMVVVVVEADGLEPRAGTG